MTEIDEAERRLLARWSGQCAKALEAAPQLCRHLHEVLSDEDWRQDNEIQGPLPGDSSAQGVFGAFSKIVPDEFLSHHVLVVRRALNTAQVASTALSDKDEKAAVLLYLYGLLQAVQPASLLRAGSGHSLIEVPLAHLHLAAVVAELILGSPPKLERLQDNRILPSNYIDLTALPVSGDDSATHKAEIRAHVFKSLPNGATWPDDHDGQLDLLRQRLKADRGAFDRHWRLAFKRGWGGLLDHEGEAQRLAEQLEIPVVSYGLAEQAALSAVLKVRAESFEQHVLDLVSDTERCFRPERGRQREMDDLRLELERLRDQAIAAQNHRKDEQLSRLITVLQDALASKHDGSTSWLRRHWAGLEEALKPIAAMKDASEFVEIARKLGEQLADYASLVGAS